LTICKAEREINKILNLNWHTDLHLFFPEAMKTIHSLKITNFKSIDSLEVKGLTHFSIFAGPNGSGKSNFFYALDFVSLFARNGIDTALRAHGGFGNIHSEKRRARFSGRFDFEIRCDLPEITQEQKEKTSDFHYFLSIHDLDVAPKIEERLHIGDEPIFRRKKGEGPNIIKGKKDRKDMYVERFPPNYSALLFFGVPFVKGTPLVELLRNLSLYRIDPIGAKEPNQSDRDPTKLDRKGHNLASVLSRMEGNPSTRETILE